MSVTPVRDGRHVCNLPQLRSYTPGAIIRQTAVDRYPALANAAPIAFDIQPNKL